MGFSVKCLETCVKSMKIGESSNFMITAGESLGYANLEKTLRDERKSKLTGKLIKSSCCSHGAAVDDAYPDLKDIEYEILELNINLIDVQLPGCFDKELWEISHEEKFLEAPKRRIEGGELFAKKMYGEASGKYRRAIMLIESILLSEYMIDAEREIISLESYREGRFEEYVGKSVQPLKLYELLQACRLNISICAIKLKDYELAIGQCTEVLKKDSKNIKAFFRRAQAYLYIGRDLELAESDFKIVKSLISNKEEWSGIDIEIRREESLLTLKKNQSLNKEKQMYSKMFV